MAVSTDPLQRDQIGIVSRDTGARLQAPATNPALQLAAALGEVQPALQDTLTAVAQQKQADAETEAKQAAIETSGAQLSDAVREGKIKASQNPWFVSAYNRESSAIRSTDQLNQLQTDSSQWSERNNAAAFAQRWHAEVAKIGQGYTDPDSMKGFMAAEAQATQQTLATNQAYNSQRMLEERQQNLSALASDALQRAVQAGGGHISGSGAAAALAPAKAQWIATGGSLQDWNKIAITAVTTASYSIRSPGLIDLLKDPALVQGERQGDTSSYGDGTDPQTPDPPAAALTPVEGAKPAAAPTPGARLTPPVVGPITNTFAQHTARGSAGVDIAVPNGTKITTPLGGIAEVGYQKGKAGLYVKIVSPDGKVQQVLAHLAVASVQNGQHVEPGTIIGRSGQSGDATGPHVHWQLKVDGKQVDPLSYHVEQQATDAQHAEAAAGNEAPALAPAPAVQTVPPSAPPQGPSLYDIAGVADAAESDRYRISQAVRAEAGDKLQAIVNQRKLDSLAASDRLYQTFGTKLLTGDVDEGTIINTLAKVGYSPQVIAGAVDNIQNAVSTSASLSSARTALAAAPGTPAAAQVFNLATRAHTEGYSPEYEHDVANAVISGQVTPEEGASWVGQAVSRSEAQQSEARAQTAFNERQGAIGTPGQVIRKAGDLSRGIDTFVAQATVLANRLAVSTPGISTRGGLSTGTQKIIKGKLRSVVLEHLATHPADWAGAEQAARDYVANFLRDIQLQSQAHQGKAPPTAAGTTSANPRGQ